MKNLRLIAARELAVLALVNAAEVASKQGKAQQSQFIDAMVEMLELHFARGLLNGYSGEMVQQIRREARRIELQINGFEPKRVRLGELLQ